MMNIWSMQKHDAVRVLLLELQQYLDKQLFCIDPASDSDYYGVMLYKADHRGIRAYVHIHGQHDNQYGIHVEYPSFKEHAASDQLQIYENQSLQQIISTLEIHFEISADQIAG